MKINLSTSLPRHFPIKPLPLFIPSPDGTVNYDKYSTPSTSEPPPTLRPDPVSSRWRQAVACAQEIAALEHNGSGGRKARPLDPGLLGPLGQRELEKRQGTGITLNGNRNTLLNAL